MTAVLSNGSLPLGGRCQLLSIGTGKPHRTSKYVQKQCKYTHLPARNDINADWAVKLQLIQTNKSTDEQTNKQIILPP